MNPEEKSGPKPSWIAKLLGDAYKPGTPITDVDAIPARREAISMPSINVDLPELAAIHEDVLLRERDGRRLTAEIYVPKGEGPFPAVTFFHGGAWCVWSPADLRRTATRIAAAGHVVVNVDYGLAPENKYPVAVEDALYGARWTVAHGPEYGADGGALTLAGDSAGATLSCGVISYLDGMPGRELDEGDLAGQEIDFAAALLLYGVYDFGTKMLQPDTTPGTTEIMFNLAYLGTNFTKFHSEPLVSPMRAPNLASFPPVYLNAGSEDALLTQSLEMTKAFADAGVSTTLSVVADVDHEFLQLDPHLPHVAAEWSRMLRWLVAYTGAKDLDAALAGLPVPEAPSKS